MLANHTNSQLHRRFCCNVTVTSCYCALRHPDMPYITASQRYPPANISLNTNITNVSLVHKLGLAQGPNTLGMNRGRSDAEGYSDPRRQSASYQHCSPRYDDRYDYTSSRRSGWEHRPVEPDYQRYDYGGHREHGRYDREPTMSTRRRRGGGRKNNIGIMTATQGTKNDIGTLTTTQGRTRTTRSMARATGAEPQNMQKTADTTLSDTNQENHHQLNTASNGKNLGTEHRYIPPHRRQAGIKTSFTAIKNISMLILHPMRRHSRNRMKSCAL